MYHLPYLKEHIDLPCNPLALQEMQAAIQNGFQNIFVAKIVLTMFYVYAVVYLCICNNEFDKMILCHSCEFGVSSKMDDAMFYYCTTMRFLTPW